MRQQLLPALLLLPLPLLPLLKWNHWGACACTLVLLPLPCTLVLLPLLNWNRRACACALVLPMSLPQQRL